MRLPKTCPLINQRLLRISVALQLAIHLTPAPMLAQTAGAPQTAAVSQLKIVILEGEGAINNIRQRTAREPIVQVEDENRKPVAGAMVLFTLPDSGPGALFADGSKSLIAYTDDKGQAKGKGLKPNSTVGAYQIVVNATAQGLKASSIINQSNALTAAAVAGGISAKLIAILAIAGGAAAAGVVAAKSGGNGGSPPPPTPTPTPTPTATITVGTPTVGGPN
ncbi:MAG: hypothetical protein L0387_34335 [Acidobacteria bacterium]|nr:hypothetical protein [Acidobacteriota bacterium]MCI0722489.1 hypothetical protein [Acidobacteriota bacterium]